MSRFFWGHCGTSRDGIVLQYVQTINVPTFLPVFDFQSRTPACCFRIEKHTEHNFNFGKITLSPCPSPLPEESNIHTQHSTLCADNNCSQQQLKLSSILGIVVFDSVIRRYRLIRLFASRKSIRLQVSFVRSQIGNDDIFVGCKILSASSAEMVRSVKQHC